MNPVAATVVKIGLLSRDQLDEFTRWKVPVEMPEGAVPKVPTLEEASVAIEEALQSEGFIITRETDLEVLHHYLTTQRPGVLHIVVPNVDVTQETEGDVEITYGVTPLGEIIIPWRSDSIAMEMANGQTYLSPKDSLSEKIFFKDIRELYFGAHKAFMICELISQPSPALMTEGTDARD